MHSRIAATRSRIVHTPSAAPGCQPVRSLVHSPPLATKAWELSWIGLLAAMLLGAGGIAWGAPIHRSGLIFPVEPWHNHGSCVVVASNGDLFACWFHGSGERKADDVRIEAARLPRGSREWSPRFTLADTPGYPDCNPSLHVDARGRLWLFYPTILDHHWEGALLKYRVSADWLHTTPPTWERSEVLHVTPGAEFDAGIQRTLPELDRLAAAASWNATTRREVEEYLVSLRSKATNELYRRLGWMPRAHPLDLGDRLILGVYHDGFSSSLMVFTEDDGAHWRTSSPLIGGGNIQPSIVRRRDGTLIAYMRDNGPPPKRLLMAESRDRGETWGPVTDSGIPNPGSGADVIRLLDGTWAFIGNDTEEGRHVLSVWLSGDEGQSWPWRRSLERAAPGKGSFSYPSLVQARDGMLHATYSVHPGTGGAIGHATFNTEWVKAAP